MWVSLMMGLLLAGVWLCLFQKLKEALQEKNYGKTSGVKSLEKANSLKFVS